MPTITPANALICTANYLMDPILGLIPVPTCTQDAVDQLMVIFKQQACTANDTATAQRVLRKRTQAERVNEEEHQIPVQAQVTPLPSFEIKENNNIIAHTPQGIPQITQDKNDVPPSANMQQQRELRTLTQEFILQCMEIPGYKAPFTAKQAASRKYPLQFLCDLTYAVLDDKTGNLLKYCHLMKHLKYKDLWTKSFGTEIHHLATTTETTFFVQKEKIPWYRKGDETYTRVVCNFCDGKKDKYRTCITVGTNLLNYPGNCGTPTANLLMVKLLLNRVISMPNVKFTTLDLKDFYLMMSLK
jgi:hypothetical protein